MYRTVTRRPSLSHVECECQPSTNQSRHPRSNYSPDRLPKNDLAVERDANDTSTNGDVEFDDNGASDWLKSAIASP